MRVRIVEREKIPVAAETPDHLDVQRPEFEKIVIRPLGEAADAFLCVMRGLLAASVLGVIHLVLPAFATMFQETGVQLPEVTDWLLWVAAELRTPVGTLAVIAALAALYRHRRSRWRVAIKRALVTISFLCLQFFPFAVIALFLPLTGGCQKL